MAVTVRTPSVTTASTSLGYMVAEYWERKAIDELYPSLVFTDIARDGGDPCWLNIPAKKGQLVHFHLMPVADIVTAAIAESADDPAAETMALSTISAQCAQYGKYTVLSDIVDAVALKSALGEAAEMMALQGMRSFDNYIYRTITGNAGAKYCGSATAASAMSATDVLTRDELETVLLSFKNRKVQTFQNGKYKYFAHPTTLKDMRGETDDGSWYDVVKRMQSGNELRSGEVADMAGFRIVDTTEIANTTAISGTGYAYKNVAAGYQSVGAVSLGAAAKPPKNGSGFEKNRRPGFKPPRNIKVIIKGLGTGGTADPLNRRATVGWKWNSVVKVLDSNTDRIFTHYAASALANTA